MQHYPIDVRCQTGRTLGPASYLLRSGTAAKPAEPTVHGPPFRQFADLAMSLNSAAPMSLKRPLSPTSLPPSKRRLVESWIETGATDYPHASIETPVIPPSAPSLDSDYPKTVSTMSAENDGGISSAERSQSIAALRDDLICRRIFEASLHQTPSNWEELRLMVAAPRRSPEPTQVDYESVYEMLRTRGGNEATYYDRVVGAKYFRRIWYAILELASLPDLMLSLLLGKGLQL